MTERERVEREIANRAVSLYRTPPSDYSVLCRCGKCALVSAVLRYVELEALEDRRPAA